MGLDFNFQNRSLENLLRNRGRRALVFGHDQQQWVCTRLKPVPICIHTCVMLTRDIVVIHSNEMYHLWSGSCPHRVEWTLLNRKEDLCDETLTASIRQSHKQ